MTVGSNFQRWNIRPDPARTDRFLIEWFNSGGKYWTAENFNEHADRVTFDQRSDSAYQAWTFVSQTDGSYPIKNDGNGRCVDSMYRAELTFA